MLCTDNFIKEKMEKCTSFFLSVAVVPKQMREWKGSGELLKEEDRIKCYKSIANGVIGGGREQLLKNLSTAPFLLQPNTNKPFLFTAVIPCTISQLFMALVKKLGVPEKGKKYEKEAPSTLYFLHLLRKENFSMMLSLGEASSSPNSLNKSPSLSLSSAFLLLSLNSPLLPLSFPPLDLFSSLLLHQLSSQHNASKVCESGLPIQFFTQFCAREASAYINSTLGSTIASIVSSNLLLEYDQSKLPPEWSAMENVIELINTCKSIVEKLLLGMSHFPHSVWKMCNAYFRLTSHISSQTKPSKNFGLIPDVCEFLFAGLFCEAIEFPEKFNLIDETPRKEATRTLQIVSEILRKISSTSRSVSKKVVAESDVSDLNLFIKENSQPVSQFVNTWAATKPSAEDKWKSNFSPSWSNVEEALLEIHHFTIHYQHKISHNNKSTLMKEVSFTATEAITTTISQKLQSK